ncbi:MAG: DUF2637 domain-containing protein, partial [Streptosporangiaceae bacterium]
MALLALIAGTVSYLHMHVLVELHGQPGWVAALTPLSVDGMIVAASTTLLAESRSGRRAGVLPWALLVAGSVASLAANVAVAEPTVIGRVIAAWPSFALTASYELLTRQVRHSATSDHGNSDQPTRPPNEQRGASGQVGAARALTVVEAGHERKSAGRSVVRRELQRQAWQWALARQASDGALPTGSQIARHHGRHERWGRLVK